MKIKKSLSVLSMLLAIACVTENPNDHSLMHEQSDMDLSQQALNEFDFIDESKAQSHVVATHVASEEISADRALQLTDASLKEVDDPSNLPWGSVHGTYCNNQVQGHWITAIQDVVDKYGYLNGSYANHEFKISGYNAAGKWQSDAFGTYGQNEFSGVLTELYKGYVTYMEGVYQNYGDDSLEVPVSDGETLPADESLDDASKLIDVSDRAKVKASDIPPELMGAQEMKCGTFKGRIFVMPEQD